MIGMPTPTVRPVSLFGSRVLMPKLLPAAFVENRLVRSAEAPPGPLTTAWTR